VYFSAKDRYPDEVRMGWNWDILLIRPDGRDQKTLLSGRSQSTEGRSTFVHPEWCPDQSYVVCHGSARDASGRGYQGTFLIDWRSGESKRIMGTPVGARELNAHHDWIISPDSGRVFRHGLTSILRGRGPSAEETDHGDVLAVYDMATDDVTELLTFRRDKDPYHLLFDAESWAADGRRIMFCQAKVISWEQKQFEPDLYVVTLPGEEETPGEPPQQEAAPLPAVPATPAAAPATPAAAPATPPAVPAAADAETRLLGELICPEHLTVEAAMSCLPDGYKTYLQTDLERNLLIVNAPPAVADAIRSYVERLDTPAPQVTLDVLVTEMSRTAARDLGLDWTYAEGHVGARLPFGELGLGEIFYRGFERLDREFFSVLSALEEEGEVKIRANPRLVALSRKTATMNIRRTKYYFYTQGYDQYGRPYLQQSDISADVTGKFTPQVLGDGNILLDIEVGVGNFTFTSASSLPDVTTRQTSTSVLVREGDTVMIGGLVLTQEATSVSKTPLLGDIPLVGQLFRARHHWLEENVLTIMVTPRLGLERTGGDTSIDQN
jgi:hypothetical protein